MNAAARPETLVQAPASADTPFVRVQPTSRKEALVLAAGAVAAFHLAYVFSRLSCLIFLYLYCLYRLAGLPTPRQAFYVGLAIGYAVYAPHLAFFWTIFGWPAVALWSVLAFWLGLFVALARLCRRRFGRLATVLIPFIWTGLEYFRGELYYLRFSWLTAGHAFSASPQIFTATHLGAYGIALVLMLLVALPGLLPGNNARVARVVSLVVLAWFTNVAGKPRSSEKSFTVHVAGVQVEFPAPLEVPGVLDKLLAGHPDAELFVLSEYTFDGPVPERVMDWCRRHKKYLIAGGKHFISNSGFYNTAFVVGPAGNVVFSQVKSVPIQFFNDGLPARAQKPWESPWGRLGICICYDLSYRRVTDELVRQGAQAIVAPTMDVAEWGGYQHRLHARIGPMRAAEHNVPIFRVCSSGISQLIDRTGRVVVSAPFPGQGETISGSLDLAAPGRLPLDHWLAPFSVLVTAVTVGWLSMKTLIERFSKS